MQGRRSAGIKDVGVNVTMAASVWDRKGARRRVALRMANVGNSERKKEGKKEGNYAERRAAPAHSIAS